MESLVVAGYFACAFVGILFGIFISKRQKSDGVLKVDVSDPQKDRYLLEFHIPIEDIPTKSHVSLKVINVVDSQKFSAM